VKDGGLWLQTLTLEQSTQRLAAEMMKVMSAVETIERHTDAEASQQPCGPVKQAVVTQRHDDHKPVRFYEAPQAAGKGSNICDMFDRGEADDNRELSTEFSRKDVGLNEFDVRSRPVRAEVNASQGHYAVPPREKLQKIAVAAPNIDQGSWLWFAVDESCDLLE
jgi:hypothetical protein